MFSQETCNAGDHKAPSPATKEMPFLVFSDGDDSCGKSGMNQRQVGVKVWIFWIWVLSDESSWSSWSSWDVTVPAGVVSLRGTRPFASTFLSARVIPWDSASEWYHWFGICLVLFVLEFSLHLCPIGVFLRFCGFLYAWGEFTLGLRWISYI